MPFSKLFRSRWSALLWAGGIVWTAVDVAASSAPEPPANGATAADIAAASNDQNIALFARMMNGD